MRTARKARTLGCGGDALGICWRYVGRLAESTLAGGGKKSRKRPTRKEVSAATVAVLESGREIDCWLDDGSQCRYAPETPEFDLAQRVLRFRGVVVKRFLQPAPNQIVVLRAFQELAWPQRIDDPIPRHDDVDVRDCLHSTIEALNNHQEHPLIKFSGDGTGTGVCWTLAGETASP